MAKNTIIVAAILAIFLLLVDASIYRTTITTTEIDIDGDSPNRKSSERCRDQLRMQQGLSHCKQYLMQGRSSWDGDESVIAFRRAEFRNQQQQHLQECCQQMQQIDEEECRCKGLRQIVKEKQKQHQQGEFQGPEMEEMKRMAQDLPEKCGMEGMRCDMPQLWV